MRKLLTFLIAKTELLLKKNLPIVLSLLILLASFSYTFIGLNSNTEKLEENNQNALLDFCSGLNHGITSEFNQIQDLMVINWLNVNNISNLYNYQRFVTMASFYYNFTSDIQAINWINRTGFINWVYPYDQNTAAVNKNVITLANGEFNTGFNYSRSTNETGFTDLISLFQGGVGFASYIPLIYNNTITGYFNVVFEIKNILKNLTSYEHSLSEFSFIITEKNLSILTAENFVKTDSFVGSRNVSILTMDWQVYSRPLASEIWNTSIESVSFNLIFEATFCLIIFIITTVIKRKNDYIKKQYEEREKVMDNLVQDKKLKALGSLAGGIAHDFNNYLTTVSGQLKLVESELQVSESESRQQNIKNGITYLKSAQKNILKAKNLVDQILIFSRNKLPNFRLLNLKDEILETINLVKETTSSKITISATFDDNFFIYGDQTQLAQILMNILLNAINAIDSDKQPQIVIQVLKDDEKFNDFLLSQFKQNNQGIKFQEYGCIITIRDNGKGMSQEQLENAFDPFSSFKSSGKGSGLGLGIVHNNVSSLGGIVKIKSELGSYTEVKITLPLVFVNS